MNSIESLGLILKNLEFCFLRLELNTDVFNLSCAKLFFLFRKAFLYSYISYIKSKLYALKM